MKLLIFGDVVAKLGRRTLAEALPELRAAYKPDAIIANVENLAHGKGVTAKTLKELADVGVTVFTGGNHVWEKENPSGEEISRVYHIALPANDPRARDVSKVQEISLGSEKLFVINLLGQVGMHEEGTENPFLTFDNLYATLGNPSHVIVDFHAEATSEKVALGFYADGRASVVYGTHTHIPTADARLLSGKTGFISDIGMTGSNDSVLGVDKHVIMRRFTGAAKDPFEYPELGPVWINALYCELDSTGRCRGIEHISKKLIIK